jgi:site-specific DNA-methyltransferase (adenine-specific)
LQQVELPTEANPIVIRHGDCLEVMKDMRPASVDACVMDPPYTAAGGSTNGRSEGHDADTQFFLFWLRAVWDELRRVIKPTGCAFVFCDWQTASVVKRAVSPTISSHRASFWRVTQTLVWDRVDFGMGSPFRNGYEMIAFARGPDWQGDLIPKNARTVISHRWPYGGNSTREHGAEKPADLCSQLVRWACPVGGIVLDPFAGTGTTGVAAVREGRRAILIEQEEHYAEVARRRTSEAIGIGGLFEPPPSPPVAELFG